MKRLFVILSVFTSIICLSQFKANAQTGQEKRIANMAKALELTDDQSAKFSAISNETFTRIDSLKQAHGSRSELKPIMKTYDEKVMAILTDDQKAKYKNIKLKMNLDARGSAY